MKRSPLAVVLVLFLSVQSGCGKKDGDAADKAPAGSTAAAAALPTECQELTAALATLESCDKIPAETRTTILDGYKKMLTMLVETKDANAAASCKSGKHGVVQTMKTSGC